MSDLQREDLAGVRVVCETIADWSDRTFRPDGRRDPLATARHLEREVAELVYELETGAATERIGEELADCFHMIAHVARQCGIDLAHHVASKFVINQQRRWGTPDVDGVIEHVEDPRDA